MSNTPNPFPAAKFYEKGMNLYGRDADLSLIHGRLLSARTTLLFAGSGVGKTSFLQARLAPELENRFRICLHRTWAGADPLELLSQSIQRDFGAAAQPGKGARSPLLPYFAAPADPNKPQHKGCLLILDQFEEFFQNHKDTAALREFILALADVIRALELDVRVLLSMREEFLGELSVFDASVPDLFSNYYRLKNPNELQAREIIERTVELDGKAACDPGGLKRLLDDLLEARRVDQKAEAPPFRRDYVIPPYLQIVCHGIWERTRPGQNGSRFLADYQNGDALKELGKYCDDKLDKLSDNKKELAEMQDLACDAFGFLMTERGAKMPYAISDLAALMHVKDEKKETLRKALEALSKEDVRILRRFGTEQEPWFELYHDMYAPFLIRWKAKFEQARKDKGRTAAQRRGAAFATTFWVAILAVVGFMSGIVAPWKLLNILKNADATADYAKLAKAQADLQEYPVYFKSKANELWAAYLDKRAGEAALSENRDAAILFAQKALAVPDQATPDRRALLGAWLGSGYERLRASFRPEGTVQTVALTRDGKTILVGLEGGRVQRWNSQTGEPRAEPVRFDDSPTGSSGFGAGSTTPSPEGRPAKRPSRAVPPVRAEREYQVVDFSRDGTRAVVVRTEILGEKENAKVFLMDTSTGAAQSIAVEPPRDRPIVTQFRLDGGLLAVTTKEGVALLDLSVSPSGKRRASPTLAALASLPHPAAVGSMAFLDSADNKLLASLDEDGWVRIWALSTPPTRPLLTWRLPEWRGGTDSIDEGGYGLSFSPDGRLLIRYPSGAVQLWDLISGNAVGKSFGFGAVAWVFAPDGKTLLTASSGGVITAWNLSVQEPDSAPRILAPELFDSEWASRTPPTAGPFSSDGASLLMADPKGVIRLWDVGPGPSNSQALRFGSQVRVAAVNAAGTLLAYVSPPAREQGRSYVIRVLEISSGRERAALLSPESVLSQLYFLPDELGLIFSARAGPRLWLFKTRQTIPLREAAGRPMDEQEDAPVTRRIVVAADGTIATINLRAHECRLWAGDTGAPGQFFDSCANVVFSPDAKSIAVALGMPAKQVQLWRNLGGGTAGPSGEPQNLEQNVRSMAFSPDGRSLLVAGVEDHLWIWSGESPQPKLVRLPAGTNAIGAVFGPGPDRVTTATRDSQIVVWDPRSTEKPLASWKLSRRILSASALLSLPGGQAVVVLSGPWIHRFSALGGAKIGVLSRPVAGRLAAANFFPSADGSSVQLLLRPDSYTLLPLKMSFAPPDIPALAYDQQQFAERFWQMRLGLEINAAGATSARILSAASARTEKTAK